MRTRVVSMPPVYHVLVTENNQWEVIREGTERPSFLGPNRKRALRKAQKLASRRHGQVFVHQEDRVLGLDDMEMDSMLALVNGEEVSPTAPAGEDGEDKDQDSI